MRKSLLGVLLFAAVASVSLAPQGGKVSDRAQGRVVKEVRHELVMLPFYSVFDDLAYKVDGAHVTLYGAVTRPTLKSDAERVVKKIEGVESVTNDIEVLP